jgi:hypothetical protein
MTVIYCDRCKKDITTKSCFTITVEEKYTDLALQTKYRPKVFELCSLCKEDIIDTAKKGVKHAKS